MNRPTDSEAERAALAHDFWYHTIELPTGETTPGWFDLRPIVDRMPWPDLAGKRCLDVGPYDGYLSFEMERRGAAEVVATDIGSPWEWDWPLRSREAGPAAVSAMSGEKTGTGYELARAALDSKARRVVMNVYDLSPETIGQFDFVVCGSLMLHLREPVRALEAIRSVCNGQFLSAEQIDPRLSRRRQPAAWFRGGENCQWWIPNPAGHQEMLRAAGFKIEQSVKPYAIPFGEGHAVKRPFKEAPRESLSTLLATRGTGVPHVASLCSRDLSQAP